MWDGHHHIGHRQVKYDQNDSKKTQRAYLMLPRSRVKGVTSTSNVKYILDNLQGLLSSPIITRPRQPLYYIKSKYTAWPYLLPYCDSNVTKAIHTREHFCISLSTLYNVSLFENVDARGHVWATLEVPHHLERLCCIRFISLFFIYHYQNHVFVF